MNRGDEEIIEKRMCRGCRTAFDLIARDVKWYRDRGLVLPWRCRACRFAARRAARLWASAALAARLAARAEGSGSEMWGGLPSKTPVDTCVRLPTMSGIENEHATRSGRSR